MKPKNKAVSDGRSFAIISGMLEEEFVSFLQRVLRARADIVKKKETAGKLFRWEGNNRN
jgi:hypothetical protein